MKYLTCLVLSALVLVSPVYSESTANLLSSLRDEISYLEQCLIAIGNELNQMQLYSEELLQMHTQKQLSLNERINYLETEYEQVLLAKEKLETDFKVLSESEGVPTALKLKYDETVTAAEAQIRLWRIIAVIEATALAIIAGVLVYQAVK